MTYTITVSVNKGKVVKLEENSLIKDALLLFIAARRAKSGRKSVNGEAIVNDSVFDSSFITLRQGASTDPIERLPLSMIDSDRFANSNNLGFPVNLTDIRTNECTIECHSDPADIIDNEVYEITFGYIPKHLLNRSDYILHHSGSKI